MFQIGWRIVLLTLAYLGCFVVANGIAVQPFLPKSYTELISHQDAGRAGLAMLAVSLLNTAVVAHLVLRSKAGGWRLSSAIFLILYGSMTFMAQIETAAFPPVANRLPAGMLGGLFMMGLLLAAPFSLLAVWLLGKWKEKAPEPPNRLPPLSEWAWKLPLIAVLYATLYFTFGYYVAWKTPAVLAYYGGADPGSLWLQLEQVIRTTPWMPFFQLLRGGLWLAIALPVIRLMKAPTWEIALAVGLSYSVLMNSQHLFANPFMSDAVRFTHLVETASSNFIFGVLAVLILFWTPGRQGKVTNARHPSQLGSL